MLPIFKAKQIWSRLMALSLCAAVISLGYIGVYAQQYIVQRRVNQNAVNLYRQVSPPTVTPAPVTPSYDVTATPTSVAATETSVETERDRLLRAEAEGRERFADFLNINGDFRGMLLIDGLKIAEPYVQAADNNAYLKTTFEGAKDNHGCVFLSSSNDRLLTDHNNVIFGHNMFDGTMFNKLLQYTNVSTVTKAPVITLDGLTGTTTWLVFAAYTCEPDYGYINTELEGESFEELLDEINSRSLFHTDIDVNKDDRILTLSTCNYDFEDARFAVHARLLREGETVPEKVTAKKNPKPKPANVPKQIDISQFAANQTTVLRHPRNFKMYYYQLRTGGVDWFVGDTKNIQGPYPNFNGKPQTDSVISVAYTPEEDRIYMAVDRLGGKPGIFLLTSKIPNGIFTMVKRDPITPTGVDARYPLLAAVGEEYWLLYSVTEGEEERIYRLLLDNGAASGEAECLYTAPAKTGLRPSGLFIPDKNPLLIFQETSTGKAFCLWLGADGASPMPSLDSYDRISFYGEPSKGKMPMITEKGGKLSASSLSLSQIPPAPPSTATPSPADTSAPTPETTPTPESSATPVPTGGQGAGQGIPAGGQGTSAGGQTP